LLVSDLAAVNAVGDVIEDGKIVAGARVAPDSMEFLNSAHYVLQGKRVGALKENTTLVVVATNAALDKVQTGKLAALASLGVARTISPVNMMADGDVTIALSIGEMKSPIDQLGVAAADAVSRAVIRAVRFAPPMGGVPGLTERWR
jgi:L-aminopeptidase/D-esterase-like protein